MNSKEKATNYAITGFKIVTIVSAIVLLVCLLVGCFFIGFDKQQQNSVWKEWNPEWTTREATDSEMAFLKDNGVELEGRYITAGSAKLPEDAELHTYLQVSIVYSDVWFYVGEQEFSTEELRYVFYPEAESDWAKTGYSARRTIPLEDEDKDRYITFLQVADSDDNFLQKKDFTYGDKFGLFFEHIRTDYVTFISNIVLLVLSTVFLIVGFCACIVMRRVFPVLYLVIGIFNLALWAVTNTFTMELFFENWHILHDMLYLSDFSVPVAMMLYLDTVQERRYHKLYFVMESLYVPMWVVGIVLYITNIYSFHDFFMKFVWLFLGMIVCGIFTIGADVVKKKATRYKYVLIGFELLAVFAVIQVISYMVNSMQMGMAYLSLGSIILLFMCGLETVLELLNAYVERTAALSASKAKSEILARMSHEVRTPIHAIMGMNEMLLRGTEEKETRQYAEDIRRASENLLGIVNDILDFSKIESGKMELQCTDYNFAKLIYDLGNLYEVQAKEKDLEFYMEVDENLPSCLYGDDMKLWQVLSNLLSNAIKYTKEGSVTFYVGGSVIDEKVKLLIGVRDTGIGVKEDDKEKLFAAFERIENAESRGIEGTGLGLSITNRMLELMDSKLQVESDYGQGSEFYFLLEQLIVNKEPIEQVEYNRQEILQKEAVRKSFVAPDAKILVVDDKDMNLKVFTSLLRDTKIQITLAKSGKACLDYVKENRYDIIFLDHMMPEMDGIETLQEMKVMEDFPCKNIPVVAVTANAGSGSKEFYLERGFDEFLSKPFKPEDLEGVILQYLPEHLVSYEEISITTESETDLPVIRGFNWEDGMKHFNDEETMWEMVEEFYTTMSYEKEKLSDLYHQLQTEEDWKSVLDEYRIKVHSMKSSSYLLGANALGDMAKELEEAVRTENVEIILTKTPKFLEQWSNCRNRLERWMVPVEKKRAAEPEKIISWLELLRGAFETMDVDSVDSIMNELEQVSFTGNMEKLFADLKVQVVNLDVEQGMILIDKLIEYFKQVKI